MLCPILFCTLIEFFLRQAKPGFALGVAAVNVETFKILC